VSAVISDSNVEATAEADKTNTDLNSLYMKYFGTDLRSAKNILWADKEGHLGSQKARSKEDADAAMKALRDEENRNKNK
jgi:hypothetical protein